MMVGIDTMSISGYGFFEQTTFEARVDNLDVWRFVEQTLIGFTYQMHYRRVSVRLPADMRLLLLFSHLPVYPVNPACSLRSLYRCRSENGSGSEFLRYCRSWSPHRRSGEVSTHLCHVGVADHTVRGGVQQTNKGIARFRNQGSFIVRNRVQQQCQIFLFLCQFVFRIS